MRWSAGEPQDGRRGALVRGCRWWLVFVVGKIDGREHRDRLLAYLYTMLD